MHVLDVLALFVLKGTSHALSRIAMRLFPVNVYRHSMANDSGW